jgi:hypothetical protein
MRSQVVRRVGDDRPPRRSFLRVAAVMGRIDVTAPRLKQPRQPGSRSARRGAVSARLLRGRQSRSRADRASRPSSRSDLGDSDRAPRRRSGSIRTSASSPFRSCGWATAEYERDRQLETRFPRAAGAPRSVGRCLRREERGSRPLRLASAHGVVRGAAPRRSPSQLPTIRGQLAPNRVEQRATTGSIQRSAAPRSSPCLPAGVSQLRGRSQMAAARAYAGRASPRST